MEIVGETNFMMSFFSSILFRLPNLLNLISYFLVIYALILLIKCLKIVTIQPSRKEYHKKECSFSEVLLVNVMKIESYFPLKWFQYFR